MPFADHEVVNKVQALDDVRTRFEITAERAFLAEVGGGCSMPIGALAKFESLSQLTLSGLYYFTRWQKGN